MRAATCSWACSQLSQLFHALMPLRPLSRIAHPTTVPTTRGRAARTSKLCFIFALTLAPFLTHAPCPPRPTHRSGSSSRISNQPAAQTRAARLRPEQADLLSSEDLRSSRISCGPSAPSDVIVAARLHVCRSHTLIPLCPGRRRDFRLALSALGGLGSLRQPCARQLCLLQFVSLVSVDRCTAQSFRRRNFRGQSTSDRGRAA